MPVLANRHSIALESSITVIGDRLRALHRLGLTHDEFLALMAPPEHWAILKEASEIAHTGNGGGVLRATMYHPAFKSLGALPDGSVPVWFVVHEVAGRAPLLPRARAVRRDAPKELLDKVAEWAVGLAGVNTSIARTHRVLNWLETNCINSSQVRFLWPAIVGLCSLDERTHDLGDRLRGVCVPNSLPAMPPEVKAALRSTATTITSGLLLQEPDGFVAPVTCNLKIEASHREGALGWVASG